MGFAGECFYPEGRLTELLEDVLPHLNVLRSLDCGQDTGFGLVHWNITRIECPLQYLRVPINDISQLTDLISRERLSTTLEEFHVTMRNDHVIKDKNNYPKGIFLPSMMNLHTFTLVQSIFSECRIAWSTIELLTSSDVMPVLQRMNLSIFINDNELDSIKRSSLFFDDDRRIDIQFAFIIDRSLFSNKLDDHLPHGNRFHQRELVGVTCVINHLFGDYHRMTNVNSYVSIFVFRFDKNLFFC